MPQGNMRRVQRSELPEIAKLLVKKQKGLCQLCGKPFTSWDYPVVDHNHTTGVIRGALHNSCNGTEGRIKKLAQRGHKGVSTDQYLIGLGNYLSHHSEAKTKLIHPEHLTEDEKRLERNRKARLARKRKKK